MLSSRMFKIVGSQRGRRIILCATELSAQRQQTKCLAEVALAEDPPLDLPVPDPKYAEIIIAVPRDRDGTITSNRERKAGRIPGVVYSAEEGHNGGFKQLISTENKQMSRLLKRIGYSFFLSRTFDIEVRPSLDSEDIITRERVLPRSLDLHPRNDAIMNATFIRAPPEAVLKVDVPLVFIGGDACPGLRKGGYLNTMRRTVRFRCPADHIPPYVEVNLGNLDVKEKILLKDLKVHPSVKLAIQDATLPVCKIMSTRKVGSGKS